ncbi:Phosphoglycolate phosphatase, HAD superfamily [Aquimarina amphilecti]|uniref:phosphoglycolate phosphatase n=1 Tax=Aquimarina amphilecti TaxID=1038014 RepID=A0A1H7J814_AQUAM|nr:HAD family hydrolase [Aquimarina amphilecti]SEK70849.1 Phosphoglycolate phosphatase, HAD superfamily [Aquimarina amphilecti]
MTPLKDTLYIFDIDGTLTDSVPMYLISVTKAMMSLGIKDIDTDYNNYKHHTDSYALRYNYERNFKKDFSDNLLEDFENNLVTQMLEFDPVKEIKGAQSLIQLFRDNSIPFCFATGALPKPAMLKLEQCNIWYDKLLLATSMTHESREGFVMDALERAKAFYNKPEFTNIVSIGDGLWDLKTAQNLSLDFVGIGDKNKEKLIQSGATKCYSNIEEFSKTIF